MSAAQVAAALVAPASSVRRRGALLGGFLVLLGVTKARAQSALGSSTPAPVAPAPPPPDPQLPLLDDRYAPFNRIVLGRWGDPVLPDAPAFDPAALTADQADTEFPYDGVIAGLIAPPPAQDGIPRLVMVLATPDIPARMVFPPGQDNPAVAGHMQGVTVLNLQYLSGRWLTVDGGYQTRRIADAMLCAISGPAANAVGTTVQGVLAPETGCTSPWGNVLLAEGDATAWLARLADVGYGYGDPAEAARFGWVVELNALDPNNIPIKRTALGRIPRGGMAATQTPDGRPVVFFTQDEPAGALFRFIAATNATDGTALDSGTLAVAQLAGDGIKWVNLGNDVPTLVGLDGAAQAAGAEMFDAPGGLCLSADGSTLYLACGGNPARTTPDALNPRANDDNGHIISFAIPGDVTAPNFAAALILVAGKPGVDPGTQYPAVAPCWLRKPRTLSIDRAGTLWIGTDQHGNTSRMADGLFTLSQSALGQAYQAPIGAAMGGTTFAPDATIFAMVRHPGATPEASYNFPATRWPTLEQNMPPQSTLIGLVTG